MKIIFCKLFHFWFWLKLGSGIFVFSLHCFFYNKTTTTTGCNNTLEQNAIDVCCSTSNLCGYGQGHCDDSTECIDGLVCKYCDRKTYLIGTKCCMLPYIPENTIGADKLFLGQGHCTYDWECYGSLICGTSGKKDCTDKSVSNETNCCKQGMYLILRLYILV